MPHDLRLKTSRVGNKLQFDMDVEFANGDTIDSRITFRGKSDMFKEISKATEEMARAELNGGDLKVKVATDIELAEAISKLIDVLRKQNDMVKARVAAG